MLQTLALLASAQALSPPRGVVSVELSGLWDVQSVRSGCRYELQNWLKERLGVEPPDVHALERTVEEQSKRQRAQLVEAGRCYERKATLARQRVALQAERAAKVELLAKRRRASAEGWRHSTAADGGTLLSDADAGRLLPQSLAACRRS